jgi:hypothetical protein
MGDKYTVWDGDVYSKYDGGYTNFFFYTINIHKSHEKIWFLGC